jgi:hypothetical protein
VNRYRDEVRMKMDLLFKCLMYFVGLTMVTIWDVGLGMPAGMNTAAVKVSSRVGTGRTNLTADRTAHQPFGNVSASDIHKVLVSVNII